MKIAIIYFKELQWTEEQLILFFKKQNIETDPIEVKELDPSRLKEYSLILNRIYASTANENQFDFKEFIEKLEEIEKAGIKVINSSFCSMCDYSKHFAAQAMEKQNILTPKTIKVSSLEEIKKFLSEENPIIFKPDTGGRGASIYKIDSIEKIPEDIFSQKDTKSQDFIIQPLAKSIIPIDYRIFVCGEYVLCVNARTLVNGWLGSRSQGSEISLLDEFPKELKEIAIKATKTIDAEINSLDIVQTNKGFSIIENNPTPNFNQNYVDSFGFNPIEILVNHLIKNYLQIPLPKEK